MAREITRLVNFTYYPAPLIAKAFCFLITDSTVLTPALTQNRGVATAASNVRVQLSFVERAALAVGIIEIPLGIDKYFMYAEDHALVGALGGFTVSITTVCFVFLYLRWAVSVVRHELPLKPMLLGSAQIIYIVTVGLSVLAAEIRHLALCDLFLLLQAYAIFFYIANRIRTLTDLTFVVRCMAVGLAIQGLIMIGQKAMGESLYGQSIEFWLIKLDVWADGRTAGTLHSAVLAGSWIALGWLVVLPLFLVERDLLQRSFLGVCLGIGMLGILFTQTRGAVITVAFGTLLLGVSMLVRGWLPKWILKVAIIALLIGIIPLVQIVQKRVVRGDEGSAESRKHLTMIALETIAQNPIFGYGAGNCHLACLPVANTAEYRSEWYYTIHCKYLLVWIECGLFGILAFLAVLINGLRHGVSAWFQRHPILSPLGLGCAAAIAGHMVHMLVDIFNSRAQVQTLWLVLGICAVVYQQSLSSSQRLLRRGGK